MVRYLFPSVGTDVKLERRCPHCHRFGAWIHRGVRKRTISDIRTEEVIQQRQRCPFCGSTWTVRAAGVDAGRTRSDRLRAMGVFLYMLGLSYRATATFVRSLEWKGSKSAVERDVAEAGRQAKRLHTEAPRRRVRGLGVDGTGAKMAGVDAGLLFFVDVDRQRLIGVEPLVETDTKAVRRHVQRVMAVVGAEELRTDELSVYDHTVAEEDHTICLAHWLKSKCKRASDLARRFRADGMHYEAETRLEVKELLHRHWRSPHVPEESERLVRRFINCRHGLFWKANQLLQHIERSWPSVSRDRLDPTNNATERIIGLTYKIRAKTMRGFKSQQKALCHPYLAQFLRGAEGLCDLRRVI
jgi:transposase-like protein